MQLQEQRYYSLQEYLELEVTLENRNEYIDGQIIPMTGGTPNHNQIALNLSGALNFALKCQPYRVFVTDSRSSFNTKLGNSRKTARYSRY